MLDGKTYMNIVWYKSVAPSYTCMFIVLSPKTDPTGKKDDTFKFYDQ